MQKQLNLFNKYRYLPLVTFETDDNYSTQFKVKNSIRTALMSISQYATPVQQSTSLLQHLDGLHQSNSGKLAKCQLNFSSTRHLTGFLTEVVKADVHHVGIRYIDSLQT